MKIETLLAELDKLNLPKDQYAMGVIKGYRFVNLALIKKFKEIGGREKDKRDLELIKSYETAGNYG